MPRPCMKPLKELSQPGAVRVAGRRPLDVRFHCDAVGRQVAVCGRQELGRDDSDCLSGVLDS